jgi:hypothetical protein
MFVTCCIMSILPQGTEKHTNISTSRPISGFRAHKINLNISNTKQATDRCAHPWLWFMKTSIIRCSTPLPHLPLLLHVSFTCELLICSLLRNNIQGVPFATQPNSHDVLRYKNEVIITELLTPAAQKLCACEQVC